MAAENITNGVSRMRVASGEPNAEDSQRASDYESKDVICEDEVEDADDMEIRPLPVRGRGRGGGVCQEKVVSRGGRRSKGPPGKKVGKHPLRSVEEMLKLARAKRDQQAHFEGMPHNYGRMRNKEWKLQDLQKRLLEVGVVRTTDDIGKKWDNLFQQYKKVQRYQNASGGKNFFNLIPALRTKEGFNFRMEERMPRSPSVAGESAVEGDGGDGNDDDGGSAQESSFSAGSTGGNCKRKNMRQQTFEAIAEVMDKHGTLMADTVEGARKRQCSILEWQCDILEPEVDAQRRHYEASDEANRLMCTALLEIAKVIRDRLNRIGDAFRLLLTANMWIMRMGGNDARSHYKASYYSQLVTKPTLLATGSQAFNQRRHIVDFTNAVLYRLGKPPITLGTFPNYIPEWAACGISFNYNAGLADPDVAARMDWLGTGPLADETKEIRFSFAVFNIHCMALRTCVWSRLENMSLMSYVAHINVLVGSLIFCSAPLTAARSYLRSLRSFASLRTSDTIFSTLPSSSIAFCPAPLVLACMFIPCAFSASFLLGESILSAMSTMDLSSDAVIGFFDFGSLDVPSDLFVPPSLFSVVTAFLSVGFMVSFSVIFNTLSISRRSLKISSFRFAVNHARFPGGGKALCRCSQCGRANLFGESDSALLLLADGDLDLCLRSLGDLDLP
ncbi:hypothetical protein CBR_g32686 [Chara braunii]|uniref:Myb/SANT-like domain-containing protein n=1 Tax=Chara braunii TaxID=69332 RepID=A0A388LHF6_CHABU|nr:hypothetical protein CBR_g32686 [Chara braunii]|eukprot:GBG81691.1 hypothetical protein CBR_g32686 [Chara braunii]